MFESWLLGVYVCVREGLKTIAFFCGKCDQGLIDGERVWGGEVVGFSCLW